MTTATELFAAYPIADAMPELRPSAPSEAVASIRNLAAELPPLQLAALYVYADDLDSAHRIVQDDSSATASWIHAIIHRREGDFSNSLYWYHLARSHPEIGSLKLGPRQYVAEVSKGGDVETLLKLQRDEWALVYDYVVREGL